MANFQAQGARMRALNLKEWPQRTGTFPSLELPPVTTVGRQQAVNRLEILKKQYNSESMI